MRAVKAKSLRKKARLMSIGMPDRQLVFRKKQKLVAFNIADPSKHKVSESVQIFNDPKSMRGIYRTLKKAVFHTIKGYKNGKVNQ